MKIMIVDDHAEMRSTLHNYVRYASTQELEIVEYESGEDAIVHYSNQNPDFVFMDIELKSMSGFTVTEHILNKDPKAKIIIVTSYDTPGFRRKAERIGAMGFVAKDRLSDIQTFLVEL